MGISSPASQRATRLEIDGRNKRTHHIGSTFLFIARRHRKCSSLRPRQIDCISFFVYFSLLSSFLPTLAVPHLPRATKSEPCERTRHAPLWRSHPHAWQGRCRSVSDGVSTVPISVFAVINAGSPVAQPLRNTVTFYDFCHHF